MNKADRWRVTRRQYRGFRDTIKAGIGSADAFVQEVAPVPIVGSYLRLSHFRPYLWAKSSYILRTRAPSIPRNCSMLRLRETFHQTEFIHLAYNLETRCIVQRQFC